MVEMIMRYAAFSHVGRTRDNNEDAYYIPGGEGPDDLVIIADGMGGYNAGEVASRKCVEVISNIISRQVESMGVTSNERILYFAMNQANRAIWDYAQGHEFCHGMGTTAIAGILQYDTWTLAHVGDSRCYYISGDAIEQITTDHSLVEEMVVNGLITREQAAVHPNRNIITRAVGTQESVTADIYRVKMKAGDYLLLCTDGLTEYIREPELAAAFTEGVPLEQIADHLVNKANAAGGRDNITVVIVGASEDKRDGE